MKKQYFIYALCHPISGYVKYVGKTTDCMRRFYHHCSVNKKESNRRTCWIKSIRKQGLKPEMFILEQTDESNWILLEQYWICQFKAWGFKLVNGTLGGDGVLGARRSEETKIKISKNNAKGRSKKCYQFKRNGEFVSEYKSTVIASAATGIPQNDISKCCRNEYTQLRGFLWSYDSVIKVPPPYRNHNAKGVIKIDTTTLAEICEYPSIFVAAKENGIQRQNIRNVCLNKLKSVGNFYWKLKHTA